MKRTILAILVAITTLALMTCQAYAFNNPPEWNVPGGGSWDEMDNLRHVKTNADTEQLEVTTFAGPRWDFDWPCDDIKMLGAAQWYDTSPGWQGHQGLVGIDNTQGTADLSGSLTFHINNYLDDNLEKWVWDEVVFYESTGAKINHALFSCPPPPAGVMVTKDRKVNLASLGGTDPGYIVNLDGTIVPNPYCEEIIFDFFVPIGAEAYIDSFEVATVCVPEPFTMTLLVLGSAGLILRRKK